MILFIDSEKIYKFRIGHNIKILENYYRIDNIQPLYHKEACGSCSATDTLTKDFDTYLKPREGYLYFIEHVGIDGFCGFHFQMPKGQPHLTPQGYGEYIYFDIANPLDPYYLPFIVEPPNYPVLKLYNPEAAANNSDASFEGQKMQVKKLEGAEIPPKGQYTELIDYTTSGELGTA